MKTPAIKFILDLSDGQPPIECRSAEEAAWLADVWLASHGDKAAQNRLAVQRFPLPSAADESR